MSEYPPDKTYFRKPEPREINEALGELEKLSPHLYEIIRWYVEDERCGWSEAMEIMRGAWQDQCRDLRVARNRILELENG